jgi:hypothetical protein
MFSIIKTIIQKYLTKATIILLVALSLYTGYTVLKYKEQIALNQTQEQQIVTIQQANSSLQETIISLQEERANLEKAIADKEAYDKKLKEETKQLYDKLETTKDDGCWHNPVPCNAVNWLYPAQKTSCNPD